MGRARRSLEGKVVAITGGARGIGRATASALVAHGARVAIGDIDAPVARRAAQELGAGALGLPLDVTRRESFAAFLDEVEARLGPLDVLMNNAGTITVGRFADEPDAVTARAIDINLHGTMTGAKLALARFMTRGRGHLVNMASLAGKAGFAGGASYCATKHAVVGLSEALRAELRDTDIRVSVVMPVAVNTELSTGPNPGGVDYVEPDQVASAVIDALQTGRFDVYVPPAISGLVRLHALLPRPAADALRYRAWPWLQRRNARRPPH